MIFQKNYKRLLDKIEETLASAVRIDTPKKLRESMNYTLLSGGKRLRPLLYLAVIEAYGYAPDKSDFDVASAIECVHAYSLIHDDLPCMDDDDFRRGKPTNHKVFGEAIALLSGDGLLTLAFELLAKASLMDGKYAKIMHKIAESVGACGMIAGQSMEFDGEITDTKRLLCINGLKTGKLIQSAFVCGCLSTQKSDDLNIWQEIGYKFGQAFQICDDLLDERKDENSL